MDFPITHAVEGPATSDGRIEYLLTITVELTTWQAEHFVSIQLTLAFCGGNQETVVVGVTYTLPG